MLLLSKMQKITLKGILTHTFHKSHAHWYIFFMVKIFPFLPQLVFWFPVKDPCSSSPQIQTCIPVYFILKKETYLFNLWRPSVTVAGQMKHLFFPFCSSPSQRAWKISATAKCGGDAASPRPIIHRHTSTAPLGK